MEENTAKTPASNGHEDKCGLSDDLETRLAALRAATVLSSWPESVLTVLAEKSRLEAVPANVTLQPIGHVIRSVHVLVSGLTQTGAADSQGRRVALKLHRPGEVHGLFLWATQERKLRHDMVTLEPSTVLVIPIEVLDEVSAAEPSLWRAVAVESSRRLITALEIAMSFGLEPPRVRFARHILEQWECIAGCSTSVAPQVHISQQVMAELLGVSRQTVTALVRDFEEQGRLRWRYGRITVLDLDGLREAAKFVWQCEANPR